MHLSKLSIPKGSHQRYVRVGRGESSGLGKTSGRGGKGQTARSGSGIKPGFEGGQMPLYRRIPKLGFVSRQKVFGVNQFHAVNLSILEKFAAGSVVDAEALCKLGYGRNNRNQAGYKILGAGKLTKKLTVKVHAVSASARAAIEALGGTIELIAMPVKEAKNENDAMRELRERMETDEAKTTYKERAATAEYVNALARNRGMQQFCVRGLSKVKNVALMFALAHNMYLALVVI